MISRWCLDGIWRVYIDVLMVHRQCLKGKSGLAKTALVQSGYINFDSAVQVDDRNIKETGSFQSHAGPLEAEVKTCLKTDEIEPENLTLEFDSSVGPTCC